MRIIQFKGDYLIDEKIEKEKPVINIVRAIFSSNDPNWVQRLLTTSLILKTTCLDENDKMLFNTSQILSLGSYIGPYIKTPQLEINYTIDFGNSAYNYINRSQSRFKTSIELSGIEFQQDEHLDVEILEREHILNRIEDWQKRVRDLYSTIEDWLGNEVGFISKPGSPVTMYEDLMKTFEVQPTQIETLDILLNNQIMMSFKPKGLWVIGANGRIDLISRKGSLILVDMAEAFNKPIWYLYTADRKTKSLFDRNAFSNLISMIRP